MSAKVVANWESRCWEERCEKRGGDDKLCLRPELMRLLKNEQT